MCPSIDTSGTQDVVIAEVQLRHKATGHTSTANDASASAIRDASLTATSPPIPLTHTISDTHY